MRYNIVVVEKKYYFKENNNENYEQKFRLEKGII